MAESKMQDDIAQEAPVQSNTEWRDSQIGHQLVELLEDAYMSEHQDEQ